MALNKNVAKGIKTRQGNELRENNKLKLIKMTRIEYAKERLKYLKDEMGQIKNIFIQNDKLMLEFENGMNLELSDDEIIYQSVSYLESEIEKVKS
jgi:hypothetical protein